MNENDIQKIFTSAVKFLLSESKKNGKKISQAQIAKHIGVEPPSLSGYLNGHINYSETKRIQISDFFDKSYLDMLNIGQQINDGILPEKNSPIELKENKKDAPASSSGAEANKTPPQIGNVIRVYNNVVEKTGIKLDAEGQEKLFNLIKQRLQEKAADAAEKDLLDVISLTSLGNKG